MPAGNPDGGQWTSGGNGGGAVGSASGDGDRGGITDTRILSDATPDNTWISGARYAQAESHVLLVAGRGGFAKKLLKLSVREFVSRFCQGSINRELPKEFENLSIADVLDIAKGGDARARKCYKLLNEPRFRKR